MWPSLPIHHLLQEMITTTGCSPSAPNQVVVKQQAASTTFMHTRLCYAHIPRLVGCQVLEYTKRLYPSLFFPQPGASLPMLKASSDTVQLSNLGLDCCDKSCEKPPSLEASLAWFKNCLQAQAFALGACLSYIYIPYWSWPWLTDLTS